MGVLNVTPDSFSDGGRHLDPGDALRRAREMVEAGVDLLDVGGESTRPGAAPVDEAEEIRRILPVVRSLVPLGVPVSVDTRKPGVMRVAIAEGAAMINDVSALSAAGALELIADADVAVCLMHMQGEPATMQRAPTYSDVIEEVRDALRAGVRACREAAIADERIVVDPGFGFGKRIEHNVTLMRGLPRIASLGYPVLAGVSRKSMIGALTGRPQGDRVAGSLAAAIAAVERGAAIVRVHDVEATIDALRVWSAFSQ
jgi:dihydropteroate synthase